MDMSKYRVGIVGLGKVARLHADALAEIPNAAFIAGCSRTLEKARNFCGEYGAEGFDSPGTMVREKALDLVIICTPHPNHVEPTVEVLEAGAHVLVEKPLAS